MIRHLAPIAANPYSLAQLSADATSRFANVLAVNTVAVNGADSLAVYFEDAHDPAPATVAAWQQFVASYTVTHPTPEETLTTAATNQTTLQQRAQTALTANATFLALASPSNVQTVAQVQALTKECNGVIRLLLGLLDSTTGT